MTTQKVLGNWKQDLRLKRDVLLDYNFFLTYYILALNFTRMYRFHYGYTSTYG